MVPGRSGQKRLFKTLTDLFNTRGIHHATAEWSVSLNRDVYFRDGLVEFHPAECSPRPVTSIGE